MNLPKRKRIRLKDYDYSQDGYYFITICTKDKVKILCNIVGTGVLDGPYEFKNFKFCWNIQKILQ